MNLSRTITVCLIAVICVYLGLDVGKSFEQIYTMPDGTLHINIPFVILWIVQTCVFEKIYLTIEHYERVRYYNEIKEVIR